MASFRIREIIAQDPEFLRAYQGVSDDPTKLAVNTFAAHMDVLMALEIRGQDVMLGAVKALHACHQNLNRYMSEDVERRLREVARPPLAPFPWD